MAQPQRRHRSELPPPPPPPPPALQPAAPHRGGGPRLAAPSACGEARSAAAAALIGWRRREAGRGGGRASAAARRGGEGSAAPPSPPGSGLRRPPRVGAGGRVGGEARFSQLAAAGCKEAAGTHRAVPESRHALPVGGKGRPPLRSLRPQRYRQLSVLQPRAAPGARPRVTSDAPVWQTGTSRRHRSPGSGRQFCFSAEGIVS
ncbi:one cut domain family member 3-like [Gallus gallus]|uniref:one cut domain family member 3-like n=1 Tax=Gallus gallus TaxID=9031 RepID=UPI001EFF6E30|nr:one cut domain family member 3-like [Gallus gallus]XP_046795552.1 one cut domain family member 3-like [Gallus gallus]